VEDNIAGAIGDNSSGNIMKASVMPKKTTEKKRVEPKAKE
jgi:hypothetical protein